MAEFKVIDTQEEFDNRIKDRLDRAEKKAREEFTGWTSPDDLAKLSEAHKAEIEKLNNAHAEAMKKYADYDKKFKEMTGQIHAYEVASLKSRIVHEKNLPYDAVEFLQGEDEKTISESAERLSRMTGSTNFGITRNTEKASGDAKDMALKEVLEKLPKR